MPREWSPSIPVSDRVWAQAVHAVVERRLSLRQAAQTFGLQQTALSRLVRQHTLQHLYRPKATRSSASPTNSDDSRFTAPVASNGRYVFPRLNPLALGHGNPNNNNNNNSSSRNSIAPLPGVAAALTPTPPVCEMTPELNDEIVAVLREQFMQQQQYNDFETSDGRYGRLEGYADADIADVVRAIVGHNGRCALSAHFPSAGWLAMFKRENDFVDVVRARSSSKNNNNINNINSSSSSNLKNALSPQQERYNRSYELERQQYELEAQQQRRDDQLRWGQNRNYRQQAAPPPSPPQQRSPIQRRPSYSWEDADATDAARSSMPPQRLRFYEPQRQSKSENNFRRSPSAGSSTSHPGHSDGGSTSERKFRQSNLVPAKVWEAAMEDVATHGMSLRNAAKAHGVHFAALHRRLKKHQQNKINMPCEPNYIPFEDEAGVVRVIHARAEMGVLLTFTELVDLLKRTALKHRSELPEDVANALVRRFQSRVEQSIRHLIIGWPSLTSKVLYRLQDVGGSSSNKNDDGKDGRVAGLPIPAKGSLPSIVSASSGSLSSSGSSSSLSPHPQSAGAFHGMRKSPVGTAPTPTWSMNSSSNNRSRTSNVIAGKSTTNGDNANVPPATVSPYDDEIAPAQLHDASPMKTRA